MKCCSKDVLYIDLWVELGKVLWCLLWICCLCYNISATKMHLTLLRQHCLLIAIGYTFETKKFYKKLQPFLNFRICKYQLKMRLCFWTALDTHLTCWLKQLYVRLQIMVTGEVLQSTENKRIMVTGESFANKSEYFQMYNCKMTLTAKRYDCMNAQRCILNNIACKLLWWFSNRQKKQRNERSKFAESIA